MLFLQSNAKYAYEDYKSEVCEDDVYDSKPDFKRHRFEDPDAFFILYSLSCHEFAKVSTKFNNRALWYPIPKFFV